MSWSLSSDRVFCISSNSTPAKIGPGKYNVTPLIGNRTPMHAPFNLRAGPPKDPFQFYPGPGQYPPKPLKPGRGCVSVFTSNSKRSFGNATAVPAPTTYSQIPQWIPNPPVLVPPKPLIDYRAPSGYVGQDVVGYRQDEATSEWLPIKKNISGPEAVGPGSYDPTYGADPIITPVNLNMSANRDLYGSPPENPGPGAYTPQMQDLRIPAVIHTRHEERPSTSIRKIYSGPRTWSSLANETNAAFRFHGERKIFPDVESTPDPGEYDVSTRKEKPVGDMSGFGVKAKRAPFHSLDDNPGPGTYNVTNGKWVKRRKETVRHAVDRYDPSTSVPGPGAYDPEPPAHGETVRPHSVFVSGTARTTSAKTIPPGPGRYTPIIANGKVPMKIHQSRFAKYGDFIEQGKIETPAPDSYQKIELDPGPGKTIPKSPRFEPMKKSDVPGPGSYSVKHNSFLRPSRNSSIPPFDLQSYERPF